MKWKKLYIFYIDMIDQSWNENKKTNNISHAVMQYHPVIKSPDASLKCNNHLLNGTKEKYRMLPFSRGNHARDF